MRKTTCFALYYLLAGGTTLAQPTEVVPGSPRWFFNIVTAEPPAAITTPGDALYLQSLHAVGRHDLHAALPTRPIRAAPCERWPTRTDDGAGSIASALAALARDTTIVIINERHDESRHREVVRQLAIELHREGYVNYAAETLIDSAAAYPDEPFARLDAGFYSREPTFGQLLRTVKELGLRLVAYEHGDAPSQAAREQGQTDNLMREIFSVEPHAKTLIHVGADHAAEVALPRAGGELEWMAARLKAATGVDPLTIDQTRCVSTSDALELARSSTALPPGAFDVAVAHPSTTFFRGRPQWRIDAGAIAVELPETLVVTDQRTLIEVRFDAEPPDTVPLDRLMLWPGERLPLLVSPGRLRVQQYFEDGRAPRTLVLNVQ